MALSTLLPELEPLGGLDAKASPLGSQTTVSVRLQPRQIGKCAGLFTGTDLISRLNNWAAGRGCELVDFAPGHHQKFVGNCAAVTGTRAKSILITDD